MNPILILVIVIAVLGLMWMLYNSIIVAKMRVSEALSQIDVQLKRRADLIPNLVETVKGYAKHEKELFEKVGFYVEIQSYEEAVAIIAKK